MSCARPVSWAKGGNDVSGVRPIIVLATLLAAFFLHPAGSAAAHDYWIDPSVFRLDPGGRVLFYLRVGEHFSGEPAASSIERTKRFTIDSSGRRFDVLPLQHDPAGMARLSEGGLHVVSFENTPTYLELPADRFNAYLEAEGLESVLQAREAAGASRQPGREAYSRCAKALLWVEGEEPLSAGTGLHARPVGMTLELLPETNPYRMRGAHNADGKADLPGPAGVRGAHNGSEPTGSRRSTAGRERSRRTRGIPRAARRRVDGESGAYGSRRGRRPARIGAATGPL